MTRGIEPATREREDGGRGAAPAASGATPPERPRGVGGWLASLPTFQSLFEVPAYRWYALASVFSFLVMNGQLIARGWLVFELTGSYAALGGTALANAVPGLAFTMFGGVLADRVPKKRVVQAGQTASALLTLAIGTLLFFDLLRFEHLLASAFIQGLVFALMMPSRQSWLPEVVGMDRLMNAMALNSSVMNSTRLVGPLGAGFLLAWVGAEYVYFVMTALYFCSVLTLSRVPGRGAALPAGPPLAVPAGAMGGGPPGGRRPGVGQGMGPGMGPGMPGGGPMMRARGRGAAGALSDIVDGLSYLRGNRVILLLLAVNLGTVLLALPYMMLLPGWVSGVLGKGPESLGTLMSVGAIGSLSASLLVASLPSRNRGLYYLLGSLLVGVALIAFSQSTSMWLTAAIMVVLSAGSSLRMTINNVLVQSYVDDEYRGRVMSIAMLQINIVGFGGFGVGLIAASVGPQVAVLGSALLLIVVVGSFLLFVPAMRNLD